MSRNELTHLDERGRPRMVDVGAKPITARMAVAEGFIRTSAETVERIRADRVAKGNVLTIAELAGVMVGKRTAEWIPLCHPLALDALDVTLELDPALPGVRVEATARVHARTGVEMEALTAVTAALLTVYDMCKAADREMTIEGVRLVRKQGGKSGSWSRDPQSDTMR
jgi:cyclic pyranopterin monophosphate synthase